MQNRDYWVDYAKGIGILLVVYGHVSRGAYNAGLSMDADLYKLIDSIIYSFHMPLFFLLSGIFFVPSLNKYGRRGLIFEKADSVVYPYVVWSLLQGFCEVFLSRFTTAKTSMDEVLSLLWQPRAQFWFLYVLFLVFVIMALLYRDRQGIAATLAPIALVAAWVSRFYVQLPFPIDFLATYLIYFYIGTQIKIWKSWISEHTLPSCVISGLSFSVLAWIFHVRLGLVFSDKSMLALPLALSGIGLVCSVASLMAKNASNGIKWIAVLGACSMPIFLMHILAGSGVRIILSKFLHIENAPIHLIIGTSIGILLPLGVYQLSQQASMRNLAYLFSPPPFLSLKRRAE